MTLQKTHIRSKRRASWASSFLLLALGGGGAACSDGLTADDSSAAGGAPASGGESSSGGAAASGGASSGGASSGGSESSGGADTGGTDSGAGGDNGGADGAGGASPTGGTDGGTGGMSNAGDTKPSVGCEGSRTLQNGRNNVGNRYYLVDVPENYDHTHPYRVIFGLHWRGGSAEDVATGRTVPGNGRWAHYGMKKLAEGSTIFVAPQGVDAGWGQGQADLTFIDNVVEQLKTGLCIDENRIFANGFSFGGGMSFALACARPEVFRAVSVNNAAQLSGCNGGTKPIAYQGVHGIRDGVLSISSGRSLRDRFVDNNGCTRQNPPEPARDSLMHICTDYQCPNEEYPVRWCAFDEGHIAAPQDGAPSDSGDSWLAVETWNFFKRF